MPEQPPVQLVATLERLGLATAAEVARMGRRVKRLARDLPRFESVWVDALSQARILTPFQAAEVNAGRGESLRVGPYAIRQRLAQPCYVACYYARNVDSGEPVRLAVVDKAGPQAEAILAQLQSLTARVKRTDDVLRLPSTPITHAGIDAARVFAAAPWVEGQTAAEWIVHHGRFPPVVALEIARAMLAELIELENRGICHGDLSASSLILTDAGGVALILPGLRTILRPEEGYAHADLPPEAYDGLAPERISAGTPPNASSEIYACGCLWWQLLCGRPALAGGDSLAKLRAAQTGDVYDVRHYAPDAPAPLAAAISACLEREPSRRPKSMAQLAAMLGPATRGGRETLADCLARAGRPTVRWTTTVRSIRRSHRTPLWIAGAVCCLTAVLAVCWPLWHGHNKQGAVDSGQWTAGSRQQATGGSHVQEATPAGLVSTPIPEPKTPVVPATYHQPVEAAPPDLVLETGGPQARTSLKLRAGQCVRGPSGRRATVLVPAAGLTIDKENVRFENIDFVRDETAPGDESNATEPTFLELRANRAELHGCSFRCVRKGSSAVSAAISAIRWVHPARADQSETSLPSGQVRLADCLFHGVGVGLDCRRQGAIAVELKNTLRLGGGPLVRLDHCPRADELLSLALGQVTLRGGGPLLELFVPRSEEQPGEIVVLATACALVPEPGSPLLRLTSEELPRRLLGAIRWSGQGSLVAPRVPVIAWRSPTGREEAMDESSLSIAGLVRSEVGFAGQPSNDPAASRLIRWQAPLQSTEPPGIDPAAVPKG